MSDDLDIFNMNIEDFQAPAEEKTRKTVYLPDPKKGQDNVFQSVVRLLPNYKDPKKSSIHVISYWLADEANDSQGFYAHCPSTINEKSIIKDTYWKLKKSENAFEQRKAERLKRKEYYYSYVQIIKDRQNPELEGTIQIFRYPKTIKAMIDGLLNPDKDQIEMGISPVNVFDFFEGKDFLLKVKIKGGYWNYDDCKFAPSTSPLKINDVEVERNEESAKALKAYLETAETKIEDYDYQPWDSELAEKVENYLRNLTGSSVSAPKTASKNEPEEDLENLMNENSSKPAKESTASTDDSVIDDWLADN